MPCKILIDLKFKLKMEKYIRKLLVKFHLDPKIELKVMLDSVKLDIIKFYTKI